jgi:hypothetical protein
MDHSPLPRALSWTSLILLTLLAAAAESVILLPSALFPATRLAAALSWDASSASSAPETPPETRGACATPHRRPRRRPGTRPPHARSVAACSTGTGAPLRAPRLGGTG